MKTAAPFVRIVTKNVRNVLMTKSAADVISVRIVWGAMETSVTTAAPVSVVRNMFAIAATDAPNVQWCARIVMKPVQSVLPKKSAADVILVKNVPEETETSAITAKPVSIVQSISVFAVRDVTDVRFFVPNAENSVKTVQMPYVSIAENVSIVQRQTAFVRNVISVLIVPICLVPAD